MKNLKLNISYAIILFINLIFTARYLSRFSEFGILLGFVIVGIQAFAIIYINKNNLPKTVVKYSFYVFLTALISFAIYAKDIFKLESLNVDRWSVISSFFTELFNGNYPYFAKSNMGNYHGPMPIYFAIALPFHLINQLNILSILGYVLFIFIIIKQKYVHPKYAILLIVLSSSLFVYWEIATRSNIFTYSLFVLLILNIYTKINKNKYDKMFFLSAVMSGLILSTRSVFLLVYIIIFISSFMRKEIKFKSLVIYSLISIIVFSATFLPFIIYYADDFFLMNPFIIQSSFLIPQNYVVLFILISLFLSFRVKSVADRYFFSGISLFVAIFIYSLYHLVKIGFNQALFGGIGVDVSYFIFCTPFLFYFIFESIKLKNTAINKKYK